MSGTTKFSTPSWSPTAVNALFDVQDIRTAGDLSQYQSRFKFWLHSYDAGVSRLAMSQEGRIAEIFKRHGLTHSPLALR
ncbi:hypothetical protein [Ruegeria sp. THAF33]|uniref:hypothetical protein n=1 Tax=Ruegeria sp. THAF33 TaxID=2587853 RepID=UPI001269136C|nr:hypothetical protein [Ruegeria sp. THAF33]